MTLSDIIAIALGLAFTYALLSLLASSLNEAIAAVLQTRAKNFRATLTTLLNEGSADLAGLSSLADRVYGHALVSGTSPNSRPSYVPARNFTLALLNTLGADPGASSISAIRQAIAALPEGRVRQALDTLAAAAANDIDAFKKGVDKWFDDAMDRLGGEYKRWSQVILFGIGLCLAVALDVDTIRIASTLQQSPGIRTALANQATAAAGRPQTADSPVTDLTQAIVDLPIPIGWSYCTDTVPTTTVPDAAAQAPPQCGTVWRVPLTQAILSREASPAALITIAVGWLLTAIAISFGAPFWFDLLNQLVNLRTTGPKPLRADASE